MKGRNERKGCEEGMKRKWRQRMKETDERKDPWMGCIGEMHGKRWTVLEG
jgi:hypothetical protein